MSAAAPGRADPRGAITVGEALAETASLLGRAAVPAPRREARLLLADAMGVGIERIVGYPERGLTDPERARLATLVARRAAREPLSRIQGAREFWGLRFALSPATLDPRPDSETLVEALLAALPDRRAPIALLDLGTGSGCLLLALLSELPAAWGLGVDSSPAALEAAAANAAALGLAGRARFCAGDWAAMLTGGRWDAIVCNPPYVAEAELAALAPEVSDHDPPAALLAGPEGLDAYRALLPTLPGLLAPGGIAALELGADQGHSVRVLARDAGLRVRGSRRDLSGIERCLLLEGAA